MLKYKRLIMIGVLCSLLVTLAAGKANIRVDAQTEPYKHFFPLIFQPEPNRLDNFADEDPEWVYVNMHDTPSDTFFEHRNGLLYCEIRDNADRYVSYPGWRPQGDFRLEVDARFDRPYIEGKPPPFQTRNGLGLVFGGSDDWLQQYAFMLGYWGRQHAWALIRYDGKRADGSDISENISKYGGAPWFVKGFDSWNHLAVVREQDYIYLYINGERMPMPEPYYTYWRDSTYGTNRLVGLTVTSWEASFDKIEFDNFLLSPLSMPY